MQNILRTPQTIAPHLIGKHIHEILPVVTQYNLNLRLIAHKEESTLPEGIILNQTPIPGTAIKSNQPLFIVTTKKPLTIQAPQCIGIHIDELIHILQAINIRPRIYYMPHIYPEKTCFAQSPQPHDALENKLTLYISSGNNKPIIWPDFTGIPLQQVVEFLQNYNIQPHVITDSTQKNYNNEYIVIDQRPFAGTFIMLDEEKSLTVQLRVH